MGVGQKYRVPQKTLLIKGKIDPTATCGEPRWGWGFLFDPLSQIGLFGKSMVPRQAAEWSSFRSKAKKISSKLRSPGLFSFFPKQKLLLKTNKTNSRSYDLAVHTKKTAKLLLLPNAKPIDLCMAHDCLMCTKCFSFRMWVSQTCQTQTTDVRRHARTGALNG